MNLSIRPATNADIDAMIALAKHAATASQWPRRQYEAILCAEDRRRLTWVIEEEGRPQGFIVAGCLGQEWEIENIAIAGPARRRGLGTRLLGEFLDVVRQQGAESVFLEVRESNQAARALYEKWTFIECGRRPRYYEHPPEDALVYRLSFE